MKPVDEESNTTPVRPNRHAWIYNLVGFLVLCVGCVALWIYVQSAPSPKEESLSDVKAWGIEQVEKMPYIQGEYKQGSLKRIDEANSNQEARVIVDQAYKDNHEIGLLVAAQRLQSHDCENAGNK